MAIETIKTRIKNKVDSIADWSSSSSTLLDGEIAIVRVPTGDTYTNPVTGKNEPVVELLMKVGNGESTFANLPWLSAKASDVYDWAKKGAVEDVPVTVNDTQSTLGSYLKKVDTNASNISSVSDKVDVEKVSTAISNAINALDYSSSTTDTSISKIAFVTAVTQADGKIAVKKRNIIEADLPDISVNKVKVDSNTTLASKISAMDLVISANTNKLAGHTDAAINTLIATKLAGLDSTSSGSGSYVTNVTQTDGKVTVTKGNLPSANTSAAGIVKLGATGGAATYDSVFGSDGKGGINKQVADNTSDIANLKTAVAGGVHFRGTVSAEPSESTTTVGNVTIAAGDVVIYAEKEYICTAVTDSKPSWEQLGDVTRIGNLETKINNLDVTATNAVATTHKFVSQVTQTDGKVDVTYTQPTSADVSHGDDTVATKFEAVDAAIAAKADSGHTHTPYINQNAFSNIKVGTTTVAADTTTDTVEFVGSNVTITPDATNDKITFAVANGSTSAKGIVQLDNTVTSTSTSLAATANAVKTAYDKAAEAAADAASRAPSNHSHDAHEARTSAIEGNYVRFNSSDNKLYVGKNGVNEIIFDCGGAK